MGGWGVFLLCASVQWGAIPMSILVRRFPLSAICFDQRAMGEHSEEHAGHTYCDWVLWTFDSASSKQVEWWSPLFKSLRVQLQHNMRPSPGLNSPG